MFWVNKKFIPLVVGIVAVGGCATYIPGEWAPLPSRADGRENIEIVREKDSLWNMPTEISWTYAVTVNGENVHRIKNGETVRFGLEAGTYSIGIRYETGEFLYSPWKLSEINAEISDSEELTRFDVGGRYIAKPPLRSVDGIENIEVIPAGKGKIPFIRIKKRPVYAIVLMVNGQDFSKLRRVRFGLEAGEHTIGVRCSRIDEDQNEEYNDEVTINIEDGAPLIQLYAGREITDSPPCYISTEM